MNTNPNDPHRYDDMLYLPHHVSEVHPPMSRINRAAQFSPFQALTGYDGVIRETARLTDRKIQLSESEIAALDERLRLLQEAMEENPEVEITYFLPDRRKIGGRYVTVSGTVKRLDQVEGVIALRDGTLIPIGDVYAIEGGLFRFVNEQT